MLLRMTVDCFVIVPVNLFELKLVLVTGIFFSAGKGRVCVCVCVGGGGGIFPIFRKVLCSLMYSGVLLLIIFFLLDRPVFN